MSNNFSLSSANFQDGSNGSTTSDSKTDNNRRLPALPSYQSLQAVIAKLDADETLIPTINRYRIWVYSLPSTRNAAVCVALWKICLAIAVLLVVIGCTILGRTCGHKYVCHIILPTTFWYLLLESISVLESSIPVVRIHICVLLRGLSIIVACINLGVL